MSIFIHYLRICNIHADNDALTANNAQYMNHIDKPAVNVGKILYYTTYLVSGLDEEQLFDYCEGANDRLNLLI